MNRISYLSVYFFSLMGLCTACSDSAGENKSIKLDVNLIKTIDIEDVLDLGTHPMGRDTADLFIDSTSLLLSVQGGAGANAFVAQLNQAALMALRDSAKAIHSANYPNSNFVTAVRLWLSMDNYSVKSIYEPLSLCTSDTGTTRTYSVISANRFFVYQGGNFVNASTGELVKIDSYQQNMLFRIEPNNTNYRHFIKAETDRGDAKSLLYTFQELDSVMMSNQSSAVKIWSYGYRNRIQDTLRSRQGLLLSPENYDYKTKTNPKSIRLTFKGRLADRAKLCPPNCSEVSYEIVR